MLLARLVALLLPTHSLMVVFQFQIAFRDCLAMPLVAKRRRSREDGHPPEAQWGQERATQHRTDGDLERTLLRRGSCFV